MTGVFPATQGTFEMFWTRVSQKCLMMKKTCITYKKPGPVSSLGKFGSLGLKRGTLGKVFSKWVRQHWGICYQSPGGICYIPRGGGLSATSPGDMLNGERKLGRGEMPEPRRGLPEMKRKIRCCDYEHGTPTLVGLQFSPSPEQEVSWMVGPPPAEAVNFKPSSRPVAPPLPQAKKSDSVQVTGTQVVIKLKEISGGVPVLAQWLTHLTRNHEVVGSIPGLAQGVGDPALP